MKKFKIANNPFWKILKQTNKKSLHRSSLKIIKKIYISIHLQKQLYEHTHASSTRKETKKKKKGKNTRYISNEKERKGRKITERIANRSQTRSTERKPSPRELLVAAMDQHKTPVYRYHRSITKLAREFWHGGWVEIYANRSESVAGVTITTPWEGLQFWRQFNLNRSCKRELWANVYRGNRL